MEIVITIKCDLDEVVNQKTSNFKKEERKKEYSQYARFFDSTCPKWVRDIRANMEFLEAQQSFANSRLQNEGRLYLNDVYRMLGMAQTKEGQYVGWIYDLNNPVGDNYVDFGLYDLDKQIYGDDRANILLDFNVDGNILGR